MSAEPDLSRSKQELVYHAVKDAIIEGTYEPGARLVLGTIAEQFDVSVQPVREAIRRLEAEGLVDFRRNAGAQVSKVDDGRYRESVEVLAVLEAAATARSVRHLTQADLDRARAINEEMRAQMADFVPLTLTRLNREFHTVLCCRNDNAYLGEMLIREWDRLDGIRRTAFANIRSRIAQSIEEHEVLLAMIAVAAPAEDIERFSREHKLRTLRSVTHHRDATPDEKPTETT